MKPLKIGDLVAKVPIIQGGMGIGVSLSELAGTVAKEGGIGVISAAQIGFEDENFRKNPDEANYKAIQQHIKRAREIAPNGILGINIMVVTKNYAEHVKEAVKNGIDLIISGAGLPTELPGLVKGSKTKIAPIVSSTKSARVILKLWDKHHQVAPDAVIIEGPKAGGHLGFKYDQLEDEKTYSGFDEEVKGIIEKVKEYAVKYKKEIPVIVGGGVSSHEDMEHYLALGADGIQVATPFVTTKECDAHENFKNAYVNAKKEDIVLVKSPVGMPGRAVRTKFMDKVAKEGRIAPTSCFQCMSVCNPKEAVYCITERLINAVRGDVENGLVFCGADAWKYNEITTVHDVIQSYIG
ncbi:MAG: nitronate monooxygenase family protein [Anaerostipes sp.]|nr:nitronate monooxygenase family protein [Anaerostipes sp.]